MNSRHRTGFAHVERDNRELESDWNKDSLKRAIEQAYQDVNRELEDKYYIEIDQMVVVNSYTLSLHFKAEYRF